MAEMADFVEDLRPDGSRAIRLTGTWAIAHIGMLDDRLRELSTEFAELNLTEIEHIDTVGAWLVYRTARDLGANIVGADADALELIHEIKGADSRPEVDQPKANPLTRMVGQLGKSVVDATISMVDFIAFLGACVKAVFDLILHPRRFRYHSVVQHFDQVGVRAIGIIALMSVAVGVVIAQQGAVQLREFGAESYTVNLVSRLTLREMGVLMTALMVAGRSGSAFAAQIGTMKITEEIDAMRTIGVVPTEALVIPRMLAMIFMMPLLALYSSVIAIAGGGIACWLLLEIPPAAYFQRVQDVTPVTDFYICMIKATVFGANIAMAGCFQGMRVQGNAEEVGLKTTAAVVQASLLVIMIDAFFAVFFPAIGWD